MSDPRWLSDEEFKLHYSRVPRLCAETVIRTDDGILLSERSLDSWKGMWHVPGGTVFYRELVGDAARRIAKNEIGVTVDVETLLGYIEYPSEEKERGFGYSVSLVFLCRILSGTPQAGEQGTKVQFFKEIPENTVQEEKLFLTKYLQKYPFK